MVKNQEEQKHETETVYMGVNHSDFVGDNGILVIPTPLTRSDE